MTQPQDQRLYAAAAQRNREPILEVLLEALPQQGSILEIGSGSGEHAIFFAPRLTPRIWIPSDPDPLALASIAAWLSHCPSDNLRSPQKLDVRSPVWPLEDDGLTRFEVPYTPAITAIVSINMIHIAPWNACLGLLAGAERILPPGGILYLCGPFRQGGKHNAPSNAEFDAHLRGQNPAWGVRDLDAVANAAGVHGLALIRTCAMPANNLSVVFRRD